MSTILTATQRGTPMLLINAPHTQTFVQNADFHNWIFDITGDAEKPFIKSVRFSGCKIIADNLKAFDSCLFEDDCQMLIKNMPVVINTVFSTSINNNRVPDLATDKPRNYYETL